MMTDNRLQQAGKLLLNDASEEKRRERVTFHEGIINFLISLSVSVAIVPCKKLFVRAQSSVCIRIRNSVTSVQIPPS